MPAFARRRATNFLAIAMIKKTCAEPSPVRCFPCCFSPRLSGAAASHANNISCSERRTVAAHLTVTARPRSRRLSSLGANALKSPSTITNRWITPSNRHWSRGSIPTGLFATLRNWKAGTASSRQNHLLPIFKFFIPLSSSSSLPRPNVTALLRWRPIASARLGD